MIHQKLPLLALPLMFLAIPGCGDDAATSSDTGGGDVGGGDVGGGSTTVGVGGSGGSDTGGGGSGGGVVDPCLGVTADARGGVVALSLDDSIALVANRDVGTVSVFGLDYVDGLPAFDKTAELSVGGEPWQVAVDHCGSRAFVVLREEQKVVAIDGIDGTPAPGASVNVGSEPTGLAITPNGTRIYVPNWVDGTVSVIATDTMTVTATIDLNATLAATTFLGTVATRPGLAHPRSVAITNDGDADDTDETVVVTEFFAQRTAPEVVGVGTNVDTNWVGLLYTIDVSTGATATIELGSLADVGFVDSVASTPPPGCFPNQLQSVTIRNGLAYVTSICASPKGPTGGVNVKTMTEPVLSVVDIGAGMELSGSPTNLAKSLDLFYTANAFADDDTRRYPLVANDLAFDEAGVAYVSANGVDAAFRLVIDPTNGSITEVGGGPTKPFIDLAPDSLAAADLGQNPLGLVVTRTTAAPFAFVANDVSRNVTALDLGVAQEIAGLTAASARIAASTALPTASQDQAALRGRRAFNTGLGNLSSKGQGWGACQSCHFEGLSDNVTWYFARGPRQSTSLDGSFSSVDPDDQRIFNWTAVFDEAADFENVLRSLDGGVGLIVDSNNASINLTDTTLIPPNGAGGLSGSAQTAMEQLSVLQTWNDVRIHMQRVRSPRAATGLDPQKIQDGEALFAGTAGCNGCHSGAKWTSSTRFYAPGSTMNESLKTKTWDGAALVAAGFPAALLPAVTPANQVMRGAAGGDQILCVLRPVGTFGVSPSEVNVVEVRQDMTTAAQGNAAEGKGFNVPSVLGMQVGAPFFHAGNARTLEELLGTTFTAHAEALADQPLTTADREALVHYLLSVDEDATPAVGPATVGANGGVFCAP